MPKIQKIKKTIFVHTIEIFDLQVLVAVGVTVEEIKKWAEKNSKNLSGILKVKENFDITKDSMGNGGLCIEFVKDNLDYYLIWLKEYENHWEWIDILNHEIVHLRQALFNARRIKNEHEFEAYFQESTFKSIRVALSKKLK